MENNYIKNNNCKKPKLQIINWKQLFAKVENKGLTKL